LSESTISQDLKSKLPSAGWDYYCKFNFHFLSLLVYLLLLVWKIFGKGRKKIWWVFLFRFF
jgi:hypothetical protein